MSFGNFYSGKRVLITGSTGFKGAWLTLFLHHLGAETFGFSKSVDPINSFYASCGIASISKQEEGDITNYKQFSDCVQRVQPDIIFHLAAQALTISAYEEPLTTFEVNGLGTANVLETLRKLDRKCTAVIVTSDKCYRNNEWMRGYHENDVLAGIDPYSASKSVAEIISNSYFQSYFKNNGNIRMATCRAGNVIGGGDWNPNRIVPDCIRSWEKFEPITIRNPRAVRPWNFVLDVLTGYLRTAIALEREAINGQSFNFGPDPESEISVLELVQILWKHWGGGDHQPYVISENQPKFFEHTYLRLNSEKAASTIEWSPQMNISDGLESCADWYKACQHDPDGVLAYSVNTIQEYLKNFD